MDSVAFHQGKKKTSTKLQTSMRRKTFSPEERMGYLRRKKKQNVHQGLVLVPLTKILDAYLNREFNPISTSDGNDVCDDLCRHLIFINRRYFLLRRRKESAYLIWSQVQVCGAQAQENGKAINLLRLCRIVANTLNLK
jgi:hypothetical protein